MADTTTVMVHAQQLVRVFDGVIGGSPMRVCNGRELHAFLKSGKQFSDWMKHRIRQYGFEVDQDYRCFSQKSEKPQGGRPVDEYHLTLGMAKELSMVENNEQGLMARRYFIQCEKRLHQIAPQEVATIRGQTIGTDGFHCLAAVLDGKLRLLKGGMKRSARSHIWAQVHKAFSVVSAEDIPANELDSARNFIAAYAIDGEWMPPAPAQSVLPVEQAREISIRLARLNRLFHPFSEYAADVVGIGRALRGLDPKLGIEAPGYRQVLPPL